MRNHPDDNKLRRYPEVRQIPEKQPPTFTLFPYEMYEKMRGTLEEKEADSLELIKGHFKMFKKFFVPTSHGKDSIVMIHLIIRVCKELNKPLPDFWLNHTLNVYKEEAAYWKLINKFLGIEDKFKIFYPGKDEDTGKVWTVWSIAEKYGHLPNFRATWKDSAKQGFKRGTTPECCDILKKDHINKLLKALPKEDRYDCHFVGTRAQESSIRRLGVLQRCRSYFTRYRKPYPIRTCTPLSFWKDADIWAYFAKYKIPANPAYKIHNQQRMGCASCPAHVGWEIRLAKDPTQEGFGMLKMNLKILAKTDMPRLKESIKTIQFYLDKKRSETELSEVNRTKLIKLIKEFSDRITLEDFIYS